MEKLDELACCSGVFPEENVVQVKYFCIAKHPQLVGLRSGVPLNTFLEHVISAKRPRHIVILAKYWRNNSGDISTIS